MADGNLRIQPVAGVKLRFVSSTGGIAQLARYPNIDLVKDNDDATALFDLRS